MELLSQTEHFFASFKLLKEPGYLKVSDVSRAGKNDGAEEAGKEKQPQAAESDAESWEKEGSQETVIGNGAFAQMLEGLKKGTVLELKSLSVKEGETSPPKRYTSGSMILAMENAGQLIEDEELRAQIKGSGIGTSATRAEILKKLMSIHYLSLNAKTQVITPTLLGELIYEVVQASIRQLLNPELTASWEKGLTYVAEGSITEAEYMEKLERFVAGRTYAAVHMANQAGLRRQFELAAQNYKTGSTKKAAICWKRREKIMKNRI